MGTHYKGFTMQFRLIFILTSNRTLTTIITQGYVNIFYFFCGNSTWLFVIWDIPPIAACYAYMCFRK